MKKAAYFPKELTPFKYKVPGVRLPSFNDKQLDRKTGKPITVTHPVLYRIAGIAPLCVALATGILLVIFQNSVIIYILFLISIIWAFLYGLFGNLLFRWEPDPLPGTEIIKAKPDRPTGRKTTTERKDK